MKKYIITLSIALALLISGVLITNASVDDSGVYNYTRITSTYATTSPLLIKSGSGVLGSIIISSSTVGTLFVYDGVTMPIRYLSGATSSIATSTATTTVAFFGASSANGTYTFDSAFSRSLTIIPSTNFNGSFTITYR